MLIQRINDFESVEVLFKTVYLKPDYLSWDDNYAFEKSVFIQLPELENRIL